MARVIMAEVHIRDSCDPSNPGDCAPEIRLSGAAELESLASEFGIVFEEARPEDTLAAWEVQGAGAVPEEELPELEAVGLCCPLEPDRAWDDSACAMVTGLSEEEALQELAKMELLTEVKRLRDEGVV